MEMLVLATAAFVLTHFVSGTPLRTGLVAAMGEWPYRGLYSLVAFATLGAMIWAYAATPPGASLWTALRLLPLLLMPFAFILALAGYWRNPTMVGADKLLKSDEPARGVIRITRHPLMWGLMLWAASHILANPDTPSLVFFGGFLLVGLLGTISQDRRKARTGGEDWARFARLTSHVPFVAVAQGRNRIVWREIGWLRPALGVALFVAFLLLHTWLFGARPY